MNKRMHFAIGVIFGVILSGILKFFFSTRYSHFDLMLWFLIFSLISDFDYVFFGERQYLHSLFIASIFFSIFLISAFILSYIYEEFEFLLPILAFAGMVLHIFSDSLTRYGVPFFYPLGKRHMFFPIIGGRLRLENKFYNKNTFLTSIAVFLILMTIEIVLDKSLVLRAVISWITVTFK